MGGVFALVIIVIGLALFVLGWFASKQKPTLNDMSPRNITWLFGGGFTIVGLLLLGFMSFTTVDEGEVVVPVQFGEALTPLDSPGINLKSPFARTVVMPTRTVELTFKGRTEAETEEGEASLGSINSLSAEGAQVSVDVTVLYHIDPSMTAEVYRTVGKLWEDVLVIPRVRNTTRDCIPQFDFEEARTTLRGEASGCILDKMQQALGFRGVVIEDVLLRDMRASTTLQNAIDAKLEAQSNAQRAEFIQREALVEAETVRITAEGQANALIEQATGEAVAIRLVAEAEADANRLIAASLTSDLLQLRIYEQLGDKAVIITDGGTFTPLPILPLG